MELRGYDSYNITLGDEMRGERASLGKSLDDIERDMRIKARIIAAIEDCNLEGFPNPSVISGYVRSYARYLGMDADTCFERFCTESGYVSPAAQALYGVTPRAKSTGAVPPLRNNLDPLGRSRFAAVPTSTRFRPSISLGAITSACALLGLISALSYGGYALLQDIQRVGFAPLPQAPSVVVDAPSIGTPQINTVSLPRPMATDYSGGGILAEVVLPAELASVGLTERDGPISAIDPADAGLFRNPEPEPVLADVAMGMDYAIPETIPRGPLDVAAAAPTVDEVVLRAHEDAWIRVRSGDETIVFEGTLVAGESYDVPELASTPILRAGNAGGILIYVDGIPYGPVGERGRVASGVSLLAEDIRKSIPQAEAAAPSPSRASANQQRAEAAALARQ